MIFITFTFTNKKFRNTHKIVVLFKKKKIRTFYAKEIGQMYSMVRKIGQRYPSLLNRKI